MNVTEAYQVILTAARNFGQIDQTESTLTGSLMLPHLDKALKIFEPRARRMRERLEATRARRAGKPKCPKWAEP